MHCVLSAPIFSILKKLFGLFQISIDLFLRLQSLQNRFNLFPHGQYSSFALSFVWAQQQSTTYPPTLTPLIITSQLSVVSPSAQHSVYWSIALFIAISPAHLHIYMRLCRTSIQQTRYVIQSLSTTHRKPTPLPLHPLESFPQHNTHSLLSLSTVVDSLELVSFW